MAADPNERPADSDDSSPSRSSSPESSAEGESVVKESSKENARSESSSSSGSELEDSNTSDGSSDDASSDEEEPAEPAQSQQSTKEPSNTTSRPTKAFKPPSGFKPLKKQFPPSSEVSSILSNVRGKQVFHITAPAFLPLSKVKEISLAQVLQGEPVLTYEGVHYGIPPDSISQGDSSENVLLFDPKSETYHSSPMRNIQSYHIQEMIRLPQAIKGSNQPGRSTSKETVKPPKKQPKALKMRFRPIGTGNGPPETIGSSSEESEGEKPTSKTHKGSGKEKDERKRKHHHTEIDGNQASGAPRKKSKKHSSQEGTNGPSSSQMDAESGHKKSKESSKNRDGKKRKKAQEAT